MCIRDRSLPVVCLCSDNRIHAACASGATCYYRWQWGYGSRQMSLSRAVYTAYSPSQYHSKDTTDSSREDVWRILAGIGACGSLTLSRSCVMRCLVLRGAVDKVLDEPPHRRGMTNRDHQEGSRGRAMELAELQPKLMSDLHLVAGELGIKNYRKY